MCLSLSLSLEKWVSTLLTRLMSAPSMWPLPMVTRLWCLCSWVTELTLIRSRRIRRRERLFWLSKKMELSSTLKTSFPLTAHQTKAKMAVKLKQHFLYFYFTAQYFALINLNCQAQVQDPLSYPVYLLGRDIGISQSIYKKQALSSDWIKP